MHRTTPQKEKGFALLFTVLVVSILLAISLSISNITLRELVLSSTTRDSHIAFYAADTAYECALYADTKIGNVFAPTVGTANALPASCGVIEQNVSATKTRVVNPVGSKYCYSFTVDKTPGEGGVTQTVIEARGYNTCTDSIRRVERGLRIGYTIQN